MILRKAYVSTEKYLKTTCGQFWGELDRKDVYVEDLGVKIYALTQHLNVVAKEVVDYYLY